MTHILGDITTVKQAKIYHGPRTDWAEINYYGNDDHYSIRCLKADDGECHRSYATKEWITAHLQEFNGLYEEIKNGDKFTIHKDGILIETENGPVNGEGGSHSIHDTVLCACLGALLGDEFSGYEHNYKITNNNVYHAD